jgi:hypothetical protein
MRGRLKTDFLCESSSFLAGMGSVLNLRGQTHRYNESDESDDADEIALSHDWYMVGQDLYDALKIADAKYREQPART